MNRYLGFLYYKMHKIKDLLQEKNMQMCLFIYESDALIILFVVHTLLGVSNDKATTPMAKENRIMQVPESIVRSSITLQ